MSKLLIVDDSTDLLEAMEIILLQKGYTVKTLPGWNNIYKPDRDYYKISYSLVVKYKPGEIKVDKQDKRYASIKKGEYAGKKFLIVDYNKAKMMLRLTSNNRELVYEPSDVFYFDLRLTNGNVAEVVDTLLGNKLKIREKVEASNEMVTRIISENEIAEKLSGFTLSDTENEREDVSPRETNPFDNFYIPDQADQALPVLSESFFRPLVSL